MRPIERPDHLFLSSDGSLYDTRNQDWWRNKPLRRGFCYTCSKVENNHHLKATLRNGQHADGGYPLYLIAADGEPLSFNAVLMNLRQCMAAINSQLDYDWRIIGCEVNWENPALFCAHTNHRIPSAYAEDEAAVDVAKRAFDINEDPTP